MIGSVVFGGVLLSYADLEDPWVGDQCSIINRDDSCLDEAHEDCSVSVTVLVESDPVTLLTRL
jgi:hypothetical protein